MLKTAKDQLLEMVEVCEKGDTGLRKHQAFEIACNSWRQLYKFEPPFESFDGFRKFRRTARVRCKPKVSL